MHSGSSIHRGNRGYLRTALAACALLAAACNGSTTNGKGDGGPDAGQDSGPVGDFGTSVGGSCADSTCVTGLTCQNGTCLPPAPSCAGYVEQCSASVPCCEPSGDSPLLLCQDFADAGLAMSLCVSPTGGSGCNGDSDCPAPYACVNSICDIPSTGNGCNSLSDPGYHTPCVVGDGCIESNAELNAIESRGTAADPCYAAGLICLLVNTPNGEEGICVKPVVEPAAYWSPDGVPFDDTVCNPKNAQCGSNYIGADRGAPVCGPFILPLVSSSGGNDRCLESCTTGDDCDSVTFDCLKGQCKPNYCYADMSASTLSNIQKKYGGTTISGNPSALFQPCATDEDFPLACLPQYDSLSNGSSGVCVRVAGDGGGTWGDPCDPNAYRNNLGGLCQFGFYCYQGTCMPWCDVGSTADVQCPSGTTCQTAASGPLTSTALGASHAIGVCGLACDPYVDSTQNDCDSMLPDDAGRPMLGCKFSGNASDTTPPPGNCVALIDQPVAVGESCTPFGWLDTCVSGAQCMQADAGPTGGFNYLCRQLCDPSLSSNITIPAPACPSGETCVGFPNCPGTAGAACSHQGDCE